MSLTYPEDRSYHSEHLWAKAEPDGTMLVGITDYAQDQLGGVIFVDLPAVGEHFKQGVSCASIESVSGTSNFLHNVSPPPPQPPPPPLHRLLRLLNPCLQRSLRQQSGDSFA